MKTGHDARLLCEATGLPPPFLSWSKDGGENFPAARDRRFQVNSENLDEFIIKDVQWRDRGVYYCNATNAAGSIISNATLDVMSKCASEYLSVQNSVVVFVNMVIQRTIIGWFFIAVCQSDCIISYSIIQCCNILRFIQLCISHCVMT